MGEGTRLISVSGSRFGQEARHRCAPVLDALHAGGRGALYFSLIYSWETRPLLRLHKTVRGKRWADPLRSAGARYPRIDWYVIIRRDGAGPSDRPVSLRGRALH